MPVALDGCVDDDDVLTWDDVSDKMEHDIHSDDDDDDLTV